jgi:streptogramin lyase/mono/diheme cytochrome c family protein
MSMRRTAVLAVFAASLGTALFVSLPETIVAQNRTASGTITGSVTADRGEVQALRVKATDTVHKMAYTVYTNKGRYQIHNLPPSTYSVGILEETFEGPAQTVELKAGQSQTANLELKFKEVMILGAGARGAAAQENYGAARRRPDGSVVELVDFDVLYPPGPTRDLMEKNCFGCHGPTGWHGSGPRNEVGWRRAVDRMFTADGRVAGMSPGVPQQSHDRVTKQQEEDIIKYLTANFGPGSKPRDLKTDTLVRDENELSQAVFVQYETPPATGKPFAMIGPYGGPPSRSLHSAWVSVANPGVVYMSGNRSGSIVAVDTRNIDFATRTKEYRIENPQNIEVQPHGLFDRADGKVWFVELTGDRVDELDPKTGKIERYRIPTEGGGPHSIWPDSRGNFFYTYFAATGKIGKFDSRTKQVKEYDVQKDLSGYGIVTDKKDRAWAVSLNTPVILGYNPTTDKWTTYPISVPARRVAIDSRGTVWAAGYYGNNVIMLDPDSGKVTEYKMPLRYGNPYDLWPDQDDNIWIENAVYNSLVKFDPKTKKFTYFPFPELGAHTPKLDRDKGGTFWFTLGKPSTLAGFKPKGNVAGTAASTQ